MSNLSRLDYRVIGFLLSILLLLQIIRLLIDYISRCLSFSKLLESNTVVDKSIKTLLSGLVPWRTKGEVSSYKFTVKCTLYTLLVKLLAVNCPLFKHSDCNGCGGFYQGEDTLKVHLTDNIFPKSASTGLCFCFKLHYQTINISIPLDGHAYVNRIFFWG